MHDTSVTDTISFELVVFERVGTEITVRVGGMSASATVELVVFDDGRTATISPIGSCATDRLRAYELVDAVDAAAGKSIEVRGLTATETVMVGDVVEGYPVVCTADPSAPGLPSRFLHRRGDRLVLVSADGEPPSPGPAHRTTLVA
ncbi:MAG: hypothetical protein AAF480_16665 [Actinomycetota bacterium]